MFSKKGVIMDIIYGTGSYTYRQATIADLETLTQLLGELYEHHSYEDLLAENKALFAIGRQAFFLAFDCGHPMGVCHGSLRDEYVNGKAYDGTVGYLEAIYVRPDYRQHGVASTLVSLCEDWAGRNGCLEFLSDCPLDNTDSFRFHLSLGFKETERSIFFRKELPTGIADRTTVYRSMLSSDIELILGQFAAQGWEKPREVLEAYLREQDSGERIVIVAVVAGVIAGYVTLLPKVRDAVPFRGQNIPEIKDFIVFERYQRRGIGTGLMDRIEQIASETSDTVCLGVGMHSGYGSAQRLYFKRGYIPEGSGIWSGDEPAAQYSMVENDDELLLYLSKKVKS